MKQQRETRFVYLTHSFDTICIFHVLAQQLMCPDHLPIFAMFFFFFFRLPFSHFFSSVKFLFSCVFWNSLWWFPSHFISRSFISRMCVQGQYYFLVPEQILIYKCTACIHTNNPIRLKNKFAKWKKKKS